MKPACEGKPTKWWFPENAKDAARAIAICDECPIKRKCLSEARLRNEHDGIWGSRDFSKKERIPAGEMWDLTCRWCLNDFEYPAGPQARPKYCSEECRKKGTLELKREINRRYRGNVNQQAVGL